MMKTNFRKILQPALQEPAPTWLQELRQQSLNCFEDLGLPDSQQEAWKYTRLNFLADLDFATSETFPTLIKPNFFQKQAYLESNSPRLVFLNGRFDPNLSQLENLPQGIAVMSLKEVLEQNPDFLKNKLNQSLSKNSNPLIALNTAGFHDGALLHFSAQITLETPIEILYHTQSNGQPLISQPRFLIVAESGAQATLIENFSGSCKKHPYFTNAVTEVFLKENAQINYYKIQQENDQAFHLSALGIEQERNSQWKSCHISLGGKLARQEISSNLNNPGAHCQLGGLYMARNTQHMDFQTSLNHLKPHCTSQELYKGILDDAAQGVFNGKILVQPQAQKTSSSLTNNNLLLSKKAEINTKPLLEIFADDVKCSHAATIGRLDDNQVFYLKSRGINRTLARALLTYAFASEVIEQIKIERLQSQLKETLLERLHIDSMKMEDIA